MPSRQRPIPRVLSLPQDHTYVAHALPADSVLSGPVTALQARGWDQHPAFTPGWLDQHRSQLDLVHLHFGYDALTMPELRRWLADLDRLEIPLVLTVHDLRNPHHHNPDLHNGHLALLLAAAAEIVTLTDGAAAEILRRSGRRAQVIEHPRVLDTALSRDDEIPVVGIVVKARAQVVEPDRVIAAALAGCALGGVTLRVDAHPAALIKLPQTRVAAAEGRLDLQVRERFGTEEFSTYLAAVRVSVLPYRFGTHSGWLEACRDAGTRVVAPDCGYYADQWDEVISYSHNEQRGLGEESLTAAVLLALRATRLRPADNARRVRQDAQSNATHRQIWRSALESGSTSRAA